ncbi:hypothetical protein [Streptomyces ginkgonis]|uniref:hypothetical protein n=1 Tax=Streptomyces ginkgonis TaxID=1812259 RepID=UPI002176EA04|nr:hypothetical protein [Streptomyces ginkgonis]
MDAIAPGGRLHSVADQVVMGTPRPLLLAAIADRDAARVFARSQAITPLELPDLGMYLQPADSSGGTVVADLSGSGAVYTTRQRDWDGIGEHDTAYEVHRTTVVDALRDTAQGVTTWWAHQERHGGTWCARAAVLENYGVLMALEVLRALIGKGHKVPA